MFSPQPCQCACNCGNTITDQEAWIVGFGICDDCDYCGPRHGCGHPQHPHYCAGWPDVQPTPEPRRPRWLDRAAKDLSGQVRS